jgi:dihydrofolate reductase
VSANALDVEIARRRSTHSINANCHKELEMSKVTLDISISLDGYIRAANPTPEEPLGKGGERLHEWAFGADERNRELLEGAISALGATIAGRTTYDDSIKFWGADGPTGRARRPLFVVTHEPPAEVPEDGVYTFVTDGIHSALEQARAAAGDRAVAIMGGANIAQQYLAAGLVDEIAIHLVPVLFGGGTPLFERVLQEHVQLEPIEVVDTGTATHLRYRVLR